VEIILLGLSFNNSRVSNIDIRFQALSLFKVPKQRSWKVSSQGQSSKAPMTLFVSLIIPLRHRVVDIHQSKVALEEATVGQSLSSISQVPAVVEALRTSLLLLLRSRIKLKSKDW
jgi:hypothetical protein